MDKSVDSIGSCSLDVDASSTDFSDSSVGSSDCTLRSTGIPTPTTLPSFRIESTNIDEAEPKKPSYLNLACTVNGYSNITNYDSKLRENFRIPRSREVSPIRPQDYHVHTEHIGAKFLTPSYQKSLYNAPANMTENKTQNVVRSSSSGMYTYSTTTSKTVTYSNKESKKIIYSSGQDTVDYIHHNSSSNGVKSKFSHVNGKSESSVHESYMNGQQKNKSFIQQRVERLYGPGALAQGFFISKRSKNRLSESSETGEPTTTNGSLSKPSNGTSSHHEESFVCKEINELNMRQSCSSPSLPVLRHLRPEFRAQLPILSPKRVNTIEASIPKSTTVPSLTSNGIDTSNKENIDEQLIKTLAITIPEEIPAAPQVILPITKPNEVLLNGLVTAEVKDGHYFLKILKNETERLIALAVTAEDALEENKSGLTDDVLGYLRSASGKARLLVTQKMQQFEGLCHKNINQVDGEQFPTTHEDLQGFWDMVMLQVTQIDDLFAELDQIKANNWVIEEKRKPEVSDGSKSKKLIVIKKPMSANAEAQRKQREAARKQMLEERRRAMRAKQPGADQKIEIFAPEPTS